jgi:hypothetical protein
MNYPNTKSADGVATAPTRGQVVELRLKNEDRNGLHLRDHSLHISGSELHLAGTDGSRPVGNIAKG